jgi:molecular chaperone DnaK
MLSKDDVDKMVKDASEHATEDRERRDKVELHNQAEQLTYQAERTLRDLGDKVSDDDRIDVTAKIASLREALKGDNTELVKSGASELAEVLSRVSTKAYEAAASAAGGDGSAGPGEGGEAGEGAGEGEGEGEETVEGTFKEV